MRQGLSLGYTPMSQKQCPEALEAGH
jgi:hypothetical protein